MIRIPLALIPLKKMSMLEKSASSPPFFLTIEKFFLEESENVIFYEIEIGIQFGNEVLLQRITRRFSQIFRFNHLLKQALPKYLYNKIACMPPKKWFGNTKFDFVKGRCQSLQKYFSMLGVISEIMKLECFQVFFGIDSYAENPNLLSHHILKTKRYLHII